MNKRNKNVVPRPSSYSQSTQEWTMNILLGQIPNVVWRTIMPGGGVWWQVTP